MYLCKKKKKKKRIIVRFNVLNVALQNTSDVGQN